MDILCIELIHIIFNLMSLQTLYYKFLQGNINDIQLINTKTLHQN